MEGQLQHGSASGDRSQLLLRRTLRANAIFSGGSGLFLLLAAQPVAGFLGWPEAPALRILGLVLMLYGVELAFISRLAPIDRRLAWAAVVLDVLWVLGSVLLLLSNQPFTAAGKWAVVLVADVVALFAVLQYVGVR
jgi:hypothetical protein